MFLCDSFNGRVGAVVELLQGERFYHALGNRSFRDNNIGYANSLAFLSGSIVLLIFYPMELLTIAKYGMSTFEFWFLFTPSLIPTPAWVLSLFVHVTPHHLIVNIVGLLLYGLVLEHFIDRKSYLGVYVSTGLLAGPIHSNLAQSTGAGASGAIMGIVGFHSVIYLLLYRPRDLKHPVENVRYVLAFLGVRGRWTVRC